MGLLNQVLNAYGGETLWRSIDSIDATLSSGGAAYFLKNRRPFENLRVHARVAEPYVRLGPIDGLDRWAVLDGPDRVRVETANGQLLGERRNPRNYFPYGRRLFRWDDLDHAYFAGYALWNYLAFPSLLMRPDIRWMEKAPYLLEGHFPEHVPTHSPVQQFAIDPETWLVTHHYYTADVFGSWAKANHQIVEHRRWHNNIPVPARRHAYWCFPNKRRVPFPVIIWIHIHHWQMNQNY